jgi:hypothetical protein
LIAIGAFLPWFTVTAPFVGTIERTGIALGDGLLAMGMGIVIAIIGIQAVLGGGSGSRNGLIGLGIVSILGGGLEAASISSRISGLDSDIRPLADVGAGIWLVIAGGSMTAVAAAVLRTERAGVQLPAPNHSHDRTAAREVPQPRGTSLARSPTVTTLDSTTAPAQVVPTHRIPTPWTSTEIRGWDSGSSPAIINPSPGHEHEPLAPTISGTPTASAEDLSASDKPRSRRLKVRRRRAAVGIVGTALLAVAGVYFVGIGRNACGDRPFSCSVDGQGTIVAVNGQSCPNTVSIPLGSYQNGSSSITPCGMTLGDGLKVRSLAYTYDFRKASSP